MTANAFGLWYQHTGRKQSSAPLPPETPPTPSAPKLALVKKPQPKPVVAVGSKIMIQHPLSPKWNIVEAEILDCWMMVGNEDKRRVYNGLTLLYSVLIKEKKWLLNHEHLQTAIWQAQKHTKTAPATAA